MSTIRNVTVVGTGVLGSQIAFQAAFHGYAVTAYDISDEVMEKAKSGFARLAELYKADGVAGAVDGKADATISNIRLASALDDAVAEADLVIESVPESLDLKRAVYTTLGELAPARTIFATNTATLLPSALKTSTGRPDRFLALHYANHTGDKTPLRSWARQTRTPRSTPPLSNSPKAADSCRSKSRRRKRDTSSTPS